jgi:FlaA1/EpsC-like NDP-sugar epimerase
MVDTASSEFKKWHPVVALVERPVVRRLSKLFFDSAVWAGAIIVATWLRYDFDVDRIDWNGIGVSVAIAVALYSVLDTVIRFVYPVLRSGSLDEVIVIGLGYAVTGTLLTSIVITDEGTVVPRSVPLIATSLALTTSIVARAVLRLAKRRGLRSESAPPTIVVGAGEAGAMVVRALLSDRSSKYRPVAFVDDDERKARSRLEGVKVEGTIADLGRVAQRNSSRTVLLAVPSGPPSLAQRVDELCELNGLTLLVLPSLHETFGAFSSADIRALTETDLLGRPETELDPLLLSSFIEGKRVLVTGAGGSIGSELCRQISRCRPDSLFMLDRDESGLHGTQLSIDGRAQLSGSDLILADIRDAQRIRELFEERRPQIVFHAAALKHQPLLEQAAHEAWKTNVVGTFNVLQAASAVDVEHFINISTDKAANPTSVLGNSKRVAERLTSHHNETSHGTFVSVRFGNVLGSRGSVLTTFRSQSAQGLDLTVTHPDVTRYFMTIEEAVRLTIVAGSIGNPGEVLILDMGEPVKIVDVARRFANLHDPPLSIVYTGLRPGEKLTEDLISVDEVAVTKQHPLVRHVAVPPLSFESVSSSHESFQGVTAESLAHVARLDPLTVSAK